MGQIVKFKASQFNDVDVVLGLRAHDMEMEEWFYSSARKYFEQHFKNVFFDLDKKQEIFQSIFLKVWMEIDNGKIRLSEDKEIIRRQSNGEYCKMSCSLSTFIMAFAKNEYRELVRSNKLDVGVNDNISNFLQAETFAYGEENVEEIKAQIVDECIQKISPSCIEILTMFYYEGKSLDEILVLRSQKTSSKNSLKTAKHKCMNTLRNMVLKEYKKHNI